MRRLDCGVPSERTATGEAPDLTPGATSGMRSLNSTRKWPPIRSQFAAAGSGPAQSRLDCEASLAESNPAALSGFPEHKPRAAAQQPIETKKSRNFIWGRRNSLIRLETVLLILH